MLFNSYTFLFAFLPIAFGVFLLLGRLDIRLSAAWLALASFFFYGWWNPAYVWLLVASIAFNFAAGRRIARATSYPRRRWLLAFAVATNLLVLAYFKYAGFFVFNLNAAAGTSFDIGSVVLPLGISFFTFTQIAFLVDASRGEAHEYSLVHYCLFVTYFPHLIAGPILHHRDMMPQFRQAETYRFHAENVAVGLTMFAIGLFKKVMLADRISGYANPVFTAAAEGKSVGAMEAWGGALAYTLQLYFDFSGYSDMAIGLARMFNVRMPVNFHSPYQARSIIEFWRRWHMSLSRFLREYLYIPLGGNRSGKARRYVNLLITMLLGGFWHGAGWTFVAWGALHGLYLVVNNLWRDVRARLLGQRPVGKAERLSGWALTFLAVVVGWVLFRAADIDSAGLLLMSMAGANGLTLPGISTVPSVGIQQVAWTTMLLAIAFVMPNSQQVLEHFRPGLHGLEGASTPWLRLYWAPTRRWAAAMAALTAIAVLGMSKVSEFLYFQF